MLAAKLHVYGAFIIIFRSAKIPKFYGFYVKKVCTNGLLFVYIILPGQPFPSLPKFL